MGHRLGELLALEAGAGIGGDIVRCETLGSDGLRALAPDTELRPVATVYSVGRFSVGGGQVVLGAPLDLQLQKTRYLVLGENEPDYVRIPWQVQPRLFVLVRLEGPER